tara:strand:+ start:90 stop:647 length:558 start_codon:yes stop_codon:yes gene_type:complete
MKIRFANLIKNSSKGPDPGARVSGLLAAVNAITITPSFDDSTGFFDEGVGRIYPKLFTINCDFTALHEHHMGWSPGSGFNSSELQNFPFGQAVRPTIAEGGTPAAANEGQNIESDRAVASFDSGEAERANEASEEVFSRADEEALLGGSEDANAIPEVNNASAPAAAAELGLTDEQYQTFLRRSS